MKNKLIKKLVSAALMVAMAATLLAGCGGNSEEVDGTGTADAGTEATDGGDEGDTGDEGTAAPADDGEAAEIVVAIMSFAPIDTAVQDRIEGVVNEKMSAMINVTADITWYDASTYAQQVPMMIQSGEQLDAMMFTPVPAAGFSGFMSQNQLLDISEYIDAYGADIKAVLGEDGLAATSKGDGVYGAGANLSRFGGEGIVMRQDVLQELNMEDKFNNMTTWTELEEILQAAVDAGYGGVVNCDAEGTTITPQPYISGSENLADAYWVDIAGDGNQQTYIDPADNTVKCYYMNEDYKASLIRAGEWYDKGLIFKDASSADDFAATQVKNGVGVLNIRAMESGWEATEPAACGYPVSVKFTGAMIKAATASYTKFGWAVPVTAQEPEAAVKFINLLYSENEVHDTLCWGEEGVDWVKGDGVANYPDGVTEAEYHLNDFLFGDIMTITPWGDDPDANKKRIAENETVESSKYIGFSVDNTSVANEVTACQNVTNEYKPMLSSGVYGAAGTEAKYEEWIAALQAAGIDKIIAEYQSQLDAWLAEQ